jgi:hypothetical protein
VKLASHNLIALRTDTRLENVATLSMNLHLPRGPLLPTSLPQPMKASRLAALERRHIDPIDELLVYVCVWMNKALDFAEFSRALVLTQSFEVAFRNLAICYGRRTALAMSL